MPDSQSRTRQFRGRSPPDRPEWAVSTVARRTTNRDASTHSPVTDSAVRLDDVHFLVTLRKPTASPTRPDEYEEIVVPDGALGELDVWLEDRE